MTDDLRGFPLHCKLQDYPAPSPTTWLILLQDLVTADMACAEAFLTALCDEIDEHGLSMNQHLLLSRAWQRADAERKAGTG